MTKNKMGKNQTDTQLIYTTMKGKLIFICVLSDRTLWLRFFFLSEVM